MKISNIMKSLRTWPTKNRFNLLRINLHSFSKHNKTQENKAANKEFIPFQVNIELLTPQGLKYFLYVIKMLFFILVVNKNIIKVKNNEFTNKSFKHIIHHSHESTRRI
jgi:hypothetical protein